MSSVQDKIKQGAEPQAYNKASVSNKPKKKKKQEIEIFPWVRI